MEEIRKIFESFDGSTTFKKDKYGNYEDSNTHNIWVGFKNWYIANKKEK